MSSSHPDTENPKHEEAPSSPTRAAEAIKSGAMTLLDPGNATVRFVLLFCSVILMVQASVRCNSGGFGCSGTTAYAVSVGTLSAALLVLERLNARFGTVSLPASFPFYFAVFMALWWTAGAGVLTFYGPFTTTSNGYFVSWFGFFAAASMLYGEAGTVRSTSDRMMGAGGKDGVRLVMLCLSSIVVLLASIAKCASFPCETFELLALIWGIASTIAALVIRLVMAGAQPKTLLILYGCLTAFWVAGVVLFTTINSGPFRLTSNGYFGTWASFLISALLLAENAS